MFKKKLAPKEILGLAFFLTLIVSIPLTLMALRDATYRKTQAAEKRQATNCKRTCAAQGYQAGLPLTEGSSINCSLKTKTCCCIFKKQ